jgi:hypothetical protein
MSSCTEDKSDDTESVETINNDDVNTMVLMTDDKWITRESEWTARQSKDVQKYCYIRYRFICHCVVLLPNLIQIIVDYASPIEYLVMVSCRNGLQMRGLSLLHHFYPNHDQTSPLSPNTYNKWHSRFFPLSNKQSFKRGLKIHSLDNLDFPSEITTNKCYEVGLALTNNLNKLTIIKNPLHIFNDCCDVPHKSDHFVVVAKIDYNYEYNLIGLTGRHGNIETKENREILLFRGNSQLGDFLWGLYRGDIQTQRVSSIYAKHFFCSKNIEFVQVIHYDNLNYVFNLSEDNVITYNNTEKFVDVIPRLEGKYILCAPTNHGGILGVTRELTQFCIFNPVTNTDEILRSDPWCIFPWTTDMNTIIKMSTHSGVKQQQQPYIPVGIQSLYNNTIIVISLIVNESFGIHDEITKGSTYFIWMDMLESPMIWSMFSVDESFTDSFVITLFDVPILQDVSVFH